MQKEVSQALSILQSGGTILYPTDTIWGIGCDATNAQAVEKIYQIKKRDPQKSMLVLVADLAMAERYVADIPEIALSLFEVSVDPLTLILDGAVNLAENLPAPDGSIGMRIPDDAFCQALLSRFRKPIVSTSANFTGEPSPSCFDDLTEDLKNSVDYVVDWNRAAPPVSKASSVIKVGAGGQVTILRK